MTHAQAIPATLAETLQSRFCAELRPGAPVFDRAHNCSVYAYRNFTEAREAAEAMQQGRELSPLDVETVAAAFNRAAIWADAPEGTSPRPTAKADAHARAMLARLFKRAPVAVLEALNCADYVHHSDAPTPADSFGHDLYLTCAGHGAGFWDRDTLPDGIGEALAEVIRKEWRVFHSEAEFYGGWLRFHTAEETPSN